MRYLLPLAFFMVFTVKAELIEKCGTYYAEGFYTKMESSLHDGKMKRVIIMERDTRSEFILFLNNSNLKEILSDNDLGLNFKLEVKFTSKCWYHCEGIIVKVIGLLDPFADLKSFIYPRPQPMKGKEVQCKPISFDVF